jgi:hypothetical protein
MESPLLTHPREGNFIDHRVTSSQSSSGFHISSDAQKQGHNRERLIFADTRSQAFFCVAQVIFSLERVQMIDRDENKIVKIPTITLKRRESLDGPKARSMAVRVWVSIVLFPW